jgi:hypothetical protein
MSDKHNASFGQREENPTSGKRAAAKVVQPSPPAITRQAASPLVMVPEILSATFQALILSKSIPDNVRTFVVSEARRESTLDMII